MKKHSAPRSYLSAVSHDTGLNKYGIVTRMAFLVSALGLTTVAHAGLIVEEEFNYAAGALNGTQAGGKGMTGNWGTSSTNSIATPGLGFSTASGSLCTSGNACLDMGYGGSGTRVMSTPLSGASIYFSMLINLNGTVESNRTGFEFRHNSGGGDGNLFGRVNGGWGIFTGPAGDTGITAPGGSYSTWKGVSIAADSNTHLVVYKLDFQANNVKMWVDPTPGVLEPSPSAILATGNGWTVNLNNQVADSIRIYNESSSTSSLDEFRVGTTWADVTFAGPVTITAGGTYSGNWKSLNPSTAAVTIGTTAPVTITNSCILSQGIGILASWSVPNGCPANLTVQNSYGLALNPNIVGQTKGNFINAACVANLVLTSNHIEGWAFGVAYNQNNGNNDGVTNTVKIKYNRFVNMDSRYSDGNGGYLSNYNGSEHSSGHDILLQNAYAPNSNPHTGMPGVEIAWNEFVKEPFTSAGEDVINLYESLGTSASPILIHDNFIFGAYPGNPLSTTYGYYTGGGILTDDGGGGSDLTINAGYTNVYNNQVVATLNYALASDFGNNNQIYNNRVVESGYLRNGTLTPNGNCGLILYNYQGQTSSYYFNNNIYSNVCGYVDTQSGTPTVQNAWSGSNSWNSSDSNNTWWTLNNGFPTVNDENAEYNTWLTKLTGASYQVDQPTSLPEPWQTLDIGTVASCGGASYNSGTFTVQGSGTTIGSGTADAFRGVYQSVQNSTASVTAKVTSLSYTSASAQAGLVIRDSTYPGAVSAGVFVTPGGGIVFNGRGTAGGTASTYATVSGKTAPIWLRLTRSGSTFKAYYSSNGTGWTQISTSQTIPMTNNTLVGLAVDSNANGTLNTAQFTNVTFP